MNLLPNTVIFKHVSNNMSPRDWSSVILMTLIWPDLTLTEIGNAKRNNVLHLFNVPICHPPDSLKLK